MLPDSDRLSRISLFAGLSDGELARLAAWLDEEDRVLTMFGTRFSEMQQGMPEVAQRLEDLVRSRSEAISGG